MMTMLVATLGLLPAALSRAIGSDSQRPFAIVIVGGLMVNLVMSIFILPTLYVWFAREGDPLPRARGIIRELIVSAVPSPRISMKARRRKLRNSNTACVSASPPSEGSSRPSTGQAWGQESFQHWY